MSAQYIIGIDPGVHTGFALYDPAARAFRTVASMPILDAIQAVRTYHAGGLVKCVVFEDARLRTWFGTKGREVLQGAGSIKRDCSIWAEFLASLGLAYKCVKPARGATKWNAEAFATRTGYTGHTNEHGRDAALLVWGMK